MLISFTGAQSTGKTTLLEKCKLKYTNFNYVDEVTRKVKREYNVSINELGGDETQLLILAEHIKNHMLSGNVILDRCIIDGLVYTKYLHEIGQVSKQVLDLFNGSFFYLLQKIDYIFYTNPGDVKLVDDGERSTDLNFRNRIVDIFEETIECYKSDVKIVRLTGPVEERLNTINQFIYE